MKNDEKVSFIDEKVWTHAWMTICMIIAIILYDLSMNLEIAARMNETRIEVFYLIQYITR